MLAARPPAFLGYVVPVPFTQSDLNARVGQDGVDLRLDDNPTDGLAEIQADAAAEVAFYLYRRYDTMTAAYFANAWVHAAHIACGVLLLCERRLNGPPEIVQKRWDKFVEKLEAILEGRGNASVPGLAERKSAVPVITNYRQRLWPYPQALPQQKHSTGRREGYPVNADTLEPPVMP